METDKENNYNVNQVDYKGTVYKVGDKIECKGFIGTVCFGIYEDNECYVDFEHLGFYVVYDTVEYRDAEHKEPYIVINQCTLPDFVDDTIK